MGSKILLGVGVVSVLGALILTVVVWMNVVSASSEEPADLQAVEAASEAPVLPPASPPPQTREKQGPQASSSKEELEADSQRRERFREGLKKSSQKQQELERQAESAVASRTMADRGEGIAFPSGFEVTVHSYSSPVKAEGNEYWRWKPDEGKRFAVVDVEGCAGNNLGDEERYLNPFDFSLQMPDNTRIVPTMSVVDPALGHTDLLPGDCVRGLVTFQVPKGQRPSHVRFDQIWPEEMARWSLN